MTRELACQRDATILFQPLSETSRELAASIRAGGASRARAEIERYDPVDESVRLAPAGADLVLAGAVAAPRMLLQRALPLRVERGIERIERTTDVRPLSCGARDEAERCSGASALRLSRLSGRACA